MPWIGVDAGPVGGLMLLTTPYDAQMKVSADPHGYQFSASWQAVKGRFGYTRSVRYYFVADGGMVALCKLYRDYAKAQGLLASAIKEGLRPESVKTGAQKQIDQIRDQLNQIEAWLGKNAQH